MDNITRMRLAIENEIQRCKKLHYKFAKRLSRISVSNYFESLSFSMRRGRKYYTEIWYEEGERKHKYLGSADHSDVRLIQEKHFLRKGLNMLEDHIEKLDSCIANLTRFDCEMINDSLPKAYQLSDKHLKEIEGPSEEDKWYASALAEKDRLDRQYGIAYRYNRKHIANDGTIMRSKSEVSIANEFIARGKPYIYEMPLDILCYIRHPDFTFYSNRFSRVMRWEHAGMIGNNEYMDDFSDRIDIYTRAGYIPCVDIIFSFDTKNGNIDTRIIQKLLDEYE